MRLVSSAPILVHRKYLSGPLLATKFCVSSALGDENKSKGVAHYLDRTPGPFPVERVCYFKFATVASQSKGIY